jgi:glycosyltransferase involved in cell wall biosynthesis
MKIFQVVPYYPPHLGGMEYYVQGLSEELAARGHDVTVFTSSNLTMQSISRINRVKVCSLKIMSKIYNVPVVPALFWRLMASEKPDVVHTHQYPVFFSDVSAAYSLAKKVPLLVHVHVVSDAKSPISGIISDLYYSSLGLCTLSAADSLVAPSMAYKAKLSNMHVDPNKIQVIPYGIDIKRFQSATGSAFKKKYGCESSRVILSVGRLNYQKGFQYLIQALPGILKQVPNAKLVIVGDGEKLAYLQGLSRSLGVNGSVVFTGAMNQTEIPGAYAACDVFALPSLFESFGISLIEAQATGKPVVCTRTGGAPEALIDGKTGLLVEPANPKQLESAIMHILSDDKLALSMGRAGKQFVQARYDIQIIISTMIDVYEELSTFK